MYYLELYQPYIVKKIALDQLNAHPALLSLWQALHDHGIGFFVVGGAVRDALMAREFQEIDCCTAMPMDMLMVTAEAFGFKCTPLSETLDVVTLEIDNVHYEVSRLRLETHYHDMRHPEAVTFTDSLKGDSDRRDFTVNGLYLAYTGAVYDFHDGYEDLKKGVLRTIGDPRHKMSQDALRLIRAVRIATKLGLTIDQELLAVMQSLDSLIIYVSMERRMDELRGILNDSNWHRGLALMESCGFMESGYHVSPVLSQLKVHNKPNQFVQLFAMILSLQTLEFSQDLAERLVSYALSREEKNQIKLLVWAYNHRSDPIEVLFRQGESIAFLRSFFAGFKCSEVHELMAFFDQCQEQGLPMSILQLNVSAKRLLELGAEGKQINTLLNGLFIGVHRGLFDNTRYALEAEVVRTINLY